MRTSECLECSVCADYRKDYAVFPRRAHAPLSLCPSDLSLSLSLPSAGCLPSPHDVPPFTPLLSHCCRKDRLDLPSPFDWADGNERKWAHGFLSHLLAYIRKPKG